MKKHKEGFWLHIIIDLIALLFGGLICITTHSLFAIIFFGFMILLIVADYKRYSFTEEELHSYNEFIKNHEAFMEEQRNRAREQLKRSQEAREQYNKYSDNNDE